VEADEELEFVPPSQLKGVVVGLGGFRFKPSFPLSATHLDILNALLIDALRKKGPMYSGAYCLGADGTKSICIVVGLTDVG